MTNITNPLYRRDTLDVEKHCRVLWAWRAVNHVEPTREGLLMLYSLTSDDSVDPEILKPGMNYEFTVYEIDPSTPVDFETSLFEQKELSPLVPACLGYQFEAKDDEEAIARMQGLVDKVTHHGLYVSKPEDWSALFLDGVPSTLIPPETSDAILVPPPAP